MKIAKPLARLIESFQKLPGIGPKTAQRLTYYLLHVPQIELDDFAEFFNIIGFSLVKDSWTIILS